MTLKRAQTILRKEMEFLGINFGMLESLIETQPAAFLSETHEAYRRHLDNKAWEKLTSDSRKGE